MKRMVKFRTKKPKIKPIFPYKIKESPSICQTVSHTDKPPQAISKRSKLSMKLDEIDRKEIFLIRGNQTCRASTA